MAAVLDLWWRRAVGWSMGATPNAALVSDALLMAFQRRRPDRRVVHHSDRGAAHTSLAFSQRGAELELDQSFGSTGDCYDALRAALFDTSRPSTTFSAADAGSATKAPSTTRKWLSHTNPVFTKPGQAYR